MTPILYEKNETAFLTNGICRLRDVISCEITEERNGLYECNFTYPVNGANYGEIQFGRIIATTHDETGDVQPFEIVGATRPINGVVSYHAVHISYRQTQMVVAGQNINSLADAFTLLGNAAPQNPFTYWTDKTSTGYLAACDGTPRSVRQILGGVEGSILDVYGGEFEFDKYLVKLWANRGQTRDFAVRYGVNLLDYTDEIDNQGTFTSCLAFWKSGDGQIVSATATLDIDGYNGNDIRVALDLSSKFENAPSTADLQAAAISYMQNNQTYLPARNIKVDFVRLADMPEFEQYAPLLACNLCDSIKVIFPLYNTEAYFKIVRTVWDVLKGRYIEMELGALQTTLAEALGVSSGGSSGGGFDGSGFVHIAGAETITGYKTFSNGAKITRSNSGALLELESAAADTNFLLKRTNGSQCVLESGTAVGLFGTKSNHPLQVRTNYTNRMTFGTDGSVRLATAPASASNDTQLTTTKWTRDLIKPTFNTFTPATGSVMSGRTCYYTKSGHTVNVFFAVSGLTAQSTETIYTLPSGYRPKYKITAPVQAGARSDFCSCDIDTDGTISVATHATRTIAIGLVSFIVE